MSGTISFIENLKGLSFQQKRILTEQAQDLQLWQGPALEDLWPEDYAPESKVQATAVFRSVMGKIDQIRRTPFDYSNFNPLLPSDNTSAGNRKQKEIVPDFDAPAKIIGRCPCPDESKILRCCNLRTLDAVQQCIFNCSYCSIKNFYSDSQIRIIPNLEQRLRELEPEPGMWHIGTGQSSDSLMLGDDYKTVSALADFARRNPQIIVEMKTKSSRTDWITDSLPPNLVSTWSLNAKTISEKEEHSTASVADRIRAAEKCQEKGLSIGFHIHPVIRFKGWQKEYRELVEMLTDRIDCRYVLMTGMGTLTFTKKTLKTIRNSGQPTGVTCLPLTPIAGKFSYPREMKEELFSALYGFFPATWKESVFFYLCMEEQSLWQPCLGRSYSSDAEFEQDMKKHYFDKISSISRGTSSKAPSQIE